MSQRVLVDQTDGIAEYAHFDTETGDLLSIERVEDVEPVLEWCKGRYNEGLANRHCEFRHAGRYPRGALEIFGRELGIQKNAYEMYSDTVARALGKDKDLTKLLINSRDLSGFRTLPGRY